MINIVLGQMEAQGEVEGVWLDAVGLNPNFLAGSTQQLEPSRDVFKAWRLKA